VDRQLRQPPFFGHRKLAGLGAKKESKLRAQTWIVVAVGTIFMIADAQAQTYDPRYPVCQQVWGINGSYIACGYTSMAQCAATASGRAAQCLVNPYFAGAGRAYRHRQMY
jgi:hypothetical protein